MPDILVHWGVHTKVLRETQGVLSWVLIADVHDLTVLIKSSPSLLVLRGQFATTDRLERHPDRVGDLFVFKLLNGRLVALRIAFSSAQGDSDNPSVLTCSPCFNMCCWKRSTARRTVSWTELPEKGSQVPLSNLSSSSSPASPPPAIWLTYGTQ